MDRDTFSREYLKRHPSATLQESLTAYGLNDLDYADSPNNASPRKRGRPRTHPKRETKFKYRNFDGGCYCQMHVALFRNPDPELTKQDKDVYTVIATYADNIKQTSAPGNRTICREAQISMTTLYDQETPEGIIEGCLSRLVRLRYIAITKENTKRGMLRNVYHLLHHHSFPA